MRIACGFPLMFAVALLAVCAGCGGNEQEQAQKQTQDLKSGTLGVAPLERKSAFAVAIASACKKFDGLDVDDVKFEIATNGTRCVLTMSGEKMNRRNLQKALSVAVTNLALEYPGLGFMRNEDNTWQILMPDDIRIPASGGFGIDEK